ncbi:interleukin 12Ba [Megalops cyprinoides]|uniref:interleukin 12Ba n=1 Tax=Megalops cyprinoides TaxID=118141 RepID=UPI001864812B|nr:interleukin 12Ba [Megalops cyprinoides]
MNLVLVSLYLLTLHSVKGNKQQTQNYWVLKPNVIVVDVNLAQAVSKVDVPLRCGDAYGDKDIIWKNNGTQVGRGNQIVVTVEEMLGGNYTCHGHAGSFLNHTLVLVQGTERRILEKSHDTDYIQCSSRNYSGAFQCSWKWSRSRNGNVVLVRAARSSVTSNITCSLDKSRLSITCQDHTHCPYSEETERINLTVYVKNKYRVEEYSRRFYITEIVKPDKIKITKADKGTFEWGYPETWSSPNSYFPLTFQVKVIPRKKNCECESGCQRNKRVELHTTQSCRWTVREGFVFCIRAQDALCNSTWSDWSQYK